MRPLTAFLDAIGRRFRVAGWNLRGRKFYICHLAHENDRIAAETHAEYLKWAGVDVRTLEFGLAGQRPELQACLNEETIAVLGYNSQLDNSWIGDENFITAAEKRNIPVIQWILDHPSVRWPQFTTNPNAANVRYLFVSHYCEQYFRRYALPAARTAVANASFNRRSWVEDTSLQSFLARDFHCLIPLNLRRRGRTRELLETKVQHLDAEIAEAVREATERARFDLDNPLVLHLEQALARRHLELANADMHVCAGIVADMTQIWRRNRIFEVAARFPVLIQTNLAPPELLPNSAAIFRTDREWTNIDATIARSGSCRAILSVSMENDALHDRTGNALNGGCVAIVEDNVAHRRLFRPGENALFFRYDDDSLERSLELVCNTPRRAHDIAQGGVRLRNKTALRFMECHNLIELAHD